MIFYIVRARAFKTQGVHYERGEILNPEQVKNAPIKVSDGTLIKIDTANPKWVRVAQNVGRRIGINLVNIARQYVLDVEEQNALLQKQQDEEALKLRLAQEKAMQAQEEKEAALKEKAAALLAKAQAQKEATSKTKK